MRRSARGDGKRCQGYTLVELMIIVTIIMVLTSVALATQFGYLGVTRERAVKANYESALKYVGAELVKLTTSGTATADAIGDLNHGDKTNPYDSALPAFAGGLVPPLGQVVVEPADLTTVGPGGTVIVSAQYHDAGAGIPVTETTTLRRE